MPYSCHRTLVVLLVSCCFAARLLANEFETTITATKSKSVPQAVIVPSNPERATPAHPWLSLVQAGISAVPSAGPLSFCDLRIHGFSSTQIRTTVDELDISDAGTGLIDPFDLPLFAANNAELIPNMTTTAVGGTLALALKMPADFTARARSSFGSNGFGLTDISVGSGDFGGSRILAGIQLASTRGDYPFENMGPSETKFMRRSNNDHVRRLGFIKTQHSFKKADLKFFALARQHEGGLAGFATFPTPHLRLLSEKALLGSTLAFESFASPVSIRWETRYDRNETRQNDASQKESIAFMANSLTIKGERRLELMDTFSAFETKVGSSQLLDGRYRRLSGRAEFSVNTAPFDMWGMRFRRAGGIQIHSDVGWFLGFATNISAKPLERLTIGIRYAKNSRPPTLSEMFAPQGGLVLGNPNLHPEKANEGGFYLNYDHDSRLRLNFDLFYAYLANAIFYVHRNSFVVEPVNSENVHRGGVSASVLYKPNDFFENAARVDWLHSYLTATGSPLPGAAPISVSIATRLGREKGVFGSFSTVVNSGSSNNLFGTLKTSPYALLNASLHVPLLNHARLILSVTNIADVKWAKSAYHYPIPGREFFVTLESFT